MNTPTRQVESADRQALRELIAEWETDVQYEDQRSGYTPEPEGIRMAREAIAQPDPTAELSKQVQILARALHVLIESCDIEGGPMWVDVKNARAALAKVTP